VPTLYHGSNHLFDQPDLRASRQRRDFGIGFYTTTLRSQAEEWATTVTERFGGTAYLYTYELTITADLRVKRCLSISVEWLDMVKDNRRLAADLMAQRGRDQGPRGDTWPRLGVGSA